MNILDNNISTLHKLYQIDVIVPMDVIRNVNCVFIIYIMLHIIKNKLTTSLKDIEPNSGSRPCMELGLLLSIVT